jgi:hypothetical protein
MESIMLRKIGIGLTVLALGLSAIQTDAFARGGGGGHGFGGGGHGFGGGGHAFGGGGHAFGGGMASRGFSGGPLGAPGRMGMGRGGFESRQSGLRLHDGPRFRRGFGNTWGWYDSCPPYDPNYPYCYDY